MWLVVTTSDTVAAAAGIPLSAQEQASIDAYLAAGDRMAILMGLVWKIGIGLMVLILAAWLLGALPGAVRVF